MHKYTDNLSNQNRFFKANQDKEEEIKALKNEICDSCQIAQLNNYYYEFFQVSKSITRKLQDFYYEDSLDLTPFFEFITTQISEILNLDRLQIVEIASGGGKRVRAQVIKQKISVNSCFKVPINLYFQEWGYILIESSQADFNLSKNEVSFLNQLCLYIAIAIQQKNLKRQVKAEVNHKKGLELSIQRLIHSDSSNSTSDLIARLQLRKQVFTLQNENHHFSVLTDLVQKIRNSLNLKKVLATTVAELRKSLEVDRILIYKILEDGSGKVITESVFSGYSSVLGFEFAEETLPVYCQNRASKEQYKAISDVQAEYQENFPCLVKFLEKWQVKSIVIVPIVNNNKTWGFLIVHQCSFYRQWTNLEIEMLCQLSNQLAIAIKQSELYHQLEFELKEKQKTQIELQTSLKEKELLLREIHHRVKNNLNVISSLLNLQANYIDDEQIINMFTDSQNRIQSIALIHEQLYNSIDLSRINFAMYIQNLIKNFCSIHNTQTKNIKFEMNLASLTLNLETAIPCGLLINEIITNSCKHAFPNSSGGTIQINLYSKNSLYHLEIADNGVGIPKNFDLENSTSLGLRLVNLLLIQLNAELQRKKVSQGTNYIFSFAELEYGERI